MSVGVRELFVLSLRDPTDADGAILRTARHFEPIPFNQALRHFSDREQSGGGGADGQFNVR